MEDFVFIAFRKNVKKKGDRGEGERTENGRVIVGREEDGEERGVEIGYLQCRSTYVREISF